MFSNPIGKFVYDYIRISSEHLAEKLIWQFWGQNLVISDHPWISHISELILDKFEIIWTSVVDTDS